MMNDPYLSVFNSIDFSKVIDHPNILIAAAFWDDDRYQAARTCYKYMRAIDDLIDCHKSAHHVIAEHERQSFIDNVEAWIAMARNGHPMEGQEELTTTIRRFHIPLWPLEAFAKSMIYDVDHNGFKTLDDFITYSQGASVAPASIFVHLSGLTGTPGQYLPPAFDVKAAATPCAMFSYIVHIIRDFVKDHLNNLNYFADDLLVKYGISQEDLYNMARGSEITPGFRKMAAEYCVLAEKYRKVTHDVIRDIWPMLEPRYRLSLQIIFNLYLMVFERIDPERGSFTTAELNPTPDEIRKRVWETINDYKLKNTM
jgi:phytoene/squalene synthetase